jgi:hypothetical protein
MRLKMRRTNETALFYLEIKGWLGSNISSIKANNSFPNTSQISSFISNGLFEVWLIFFEATKKSFSKFFNGTTPATHS